MVIFFAKKFEILDSKKETRLGQYLYMVTTGEPADSDNFSNWAQANFRLYETRNGNFIKNF